MVGSVLLYDALGSRQHRIYIGATPEDGTQFLERHGCEKSSAPKLVIHKGLMLLWPMEPPSPSNFLPVIPKKQVSDFDHATGYLGAVAVALHPKDLTQQRQWLDYCCHALKHDHGAATHLVQQMLERRPIPTTPKSYS